MTITQQIITDAYRASNLIGVGESPDLAQQDEALRYLNRIVKSALGNEVGDILNSFPIGRKDISRPAGYPWWNDTPDNDWFVPKNTRLMCNLDNPVEVFLHPDPDDGSRLGAIDVPGNFSTNPLTIHGNGRLIEGATSVVLNVDETDKEWFYRADLGSWMLYSPLGIADDFPFPEEFDDFFVILLAVRLNPSYNTSIDAQGKEIFERSSRQFKARYTQNIQVRSELGLIRMPKTAYDRDVWNDSYWLYNPNSMFDKGWPF